MPANPKLMPGAKVRRFVNIYDYDTWAQNDPTTALYLNLPIDCVTRVGDTVEVVLGNMMIVLPRYKVVLVYTESAES